MIEKYKINGNLPEICRINANAAKDVNNLEAYAFWDILPNLLNIENIENIDSPKSPLKISENKILAYEDFHEKINIKFEIAEKNENIFPKISDKNFNSLSSNNKSPKFEEIKNKDLNNGLIIETKKLVQIKNSDLQNTNQKLANFNKLSNKSSILKISENDIENQKISKINEKIPEIDELLAKTLREQIQHFADNNDIVTATILAILLWDKIGLEFDKFKHFVFEYKGIFLRINVTKNKNYWKN